jgi:hypothetical protein
LKEKKNKGKNGEHTKNVYNCGKFGHWVNNYPKPMKKRPNQGPTLKSKIVIKCRVKGKLLDTMELDQITNVVKEDINENETKYNVDFLKIIMATVESKSNEHLVEIWYLDSSDIKHMLGNNYNFRALENFVKI